MLEWAKWNRELLARHEIWACNRRSADLIVSSPLLRRQDCRSAAEVARPTRSP